MYKRLSASIVLLSILSLHPLSVSAQQLDVAVQSLWHTIYPFDTSLDTHHLATRLSFDPLCLPALDGSYIPVAAESWQVVDENTTLFTLNRNLRYSNGDRVLAADFVWSLEKAKKEVRFSLVPPELTATVVGDQSIEIRSPYSTKKTLYLLHRIYLFNPCAFANNRGEAERYIGTGPYLLHSASNTQRKYVQNPHYHAKQKQQLKQLVLHAIEDDADRFKALENGTVQIALEAPPGLTFNDRPDLEIAQFPKSRTLTLLFNRSNALADQSLRRLLVEAVDQNFIAETIMHGDAQAAAQLIPPVLPGHDRNKKPKAAALQKTRFALPIENADVGTAELATPLRFIAPRNRYPNDSAIAKTVATMFNRVGIDVELNVYENKQYWKKYYSGAGDIAMIGWSSDTGMPLDFYNSLLRCNDGFNGYGTANFGGGCTPALDKLGRTLEHQGVDEVDASIELEALSIESDLYIPLLHLSESWAYHHSVSIDDIVTDSVVPVLSLARPRAAASPERVSHDK